MKHPRAWPVAISLLFVAQLGLRLALVFDRLPDTMATHFDLAGKPNGFQSRVTFVWTSAAVTLLLLALFSALPPLLARLPDGLFNLPNRAYWLAPERRASTLARLSVLLDWLGCATVGLLVGVFELIIRANLQRAALGNELWLLLVGYHLFMVFWIVTYMRSLRLPEHA